MSFSAREQYLRGYTREVFGAQDAHLEGLMRDAVAHGLPDIAVSPDVGHLLLLLAKLSAAKTIIELARGLAAGGRVITVEKEPRHADFARAQFERAGVADRVSVVVGSALDVIDDIAGDVGDGGADLLFFDAIKTEYPRYWAGLRRTLRQGGLLVCDNVLGAGWWMDEVGHPDRDAVDAFNRSVAKDDSLDHAVVPLREGLLVARVR